MAYGRTIVYLLGLNLGERGLPEECVHVPIEGAHLEEERKGKFNDKLFGLHLYCRPHTQDNVVSVYAPLTLSPIVRHRHAPVQNAKCVLYETNFQCGHSVECMQGACVYKLTKCLHTCLVLAHQVRKTVSLRTSHTSTLGLALWARPCCDNPSPFSDDLPCPSTNSPRKTSFM